MKNSPEEIVRIATRRSPLAMTQTNLVAEVICNGIPGVKTELVTFETEGDRRSGPLADVGGKGLFTAELETALREGRVDLAVHSAKDMPADLPDDLCIAAVPVRENPADVLVCRCGSIDRLPAGARIGTGSPRRAAQLRALRSDLVITDIRGNIGTRLNRAVGPDADLDGVLLAASGLIRAGIFKKYRDFIDILDPERFLPAAGQGTLAVESTLANKRLSNITDVLNDADSASALFAERLVVKGLGASCGSSVAVYVRRGPDGWLASAMVSRRDGSDIIRRDSSDSIAEQAASDLLQQLVDIGAERLL